MSPILVRPVREQLEHDRIIRLLQGKFKRKYEAGMNPGIEQNMPVGSGPGLLALFTAPSAVLKASTVAWIDAALGPAAENVVETASDLEEVTTMKPATRIARRTDTVSIASPFLGAVIPPRSEQFACYIPRP